MSSGYISEEEKKHSKKTPTQQYLEAVAYKKKKTETYIAADVKNLKTFKSQDFEDSLLNGTKPVTQAYSSLSPGMAKKQETMMSLFNSRKDEILSRKAMPGITQLRF